MLVRPRSGRHRRYIVAALRERHGVDAVAVTAPTGIAAQHVGGVTIHSWSGMGLGRGSPSTIIDRVCKSGPATRRWTDAAVLVIDEVSMLDSELFGALDGIGRKIRGKAQEPFGGLQVVCVGDSFQLPPVGLGEYVRGVRGDESRRRRGCVVEIPRRRVAAAAIPWRGVAATPRLQRGYSVETSRGDADVEIRSRPTPRNIHVAPRGVAATLVPARPRTGAGAAIDGSPPDEVETGTVVRSGSAVARMDGGLGSRRG